MRLPVAKTLSANIKERRREQRVGADADAPGHAMLTYLMPQKSAFIAFTYMGGISVQVGKIYLCCPPAFDNM